MIILPHERESALWVKLVEYYEDKLDTLRKRNDGDLDTEGTVRLRGRISEIKAFLALGSTEIPGAE